MNDHHSTQILETGETVLSSLVTWISEWADCSWAVAMSHCGNRLLPTCLRGIHPNLQACVDHIAALARWEPEAGEQCEPGPIAGPVPDWMPHMTLPIIVRGELAGVLALGRKNRGFAYTPSERRLIIDAVAQVSLLLESDRLAGLLGTHMASMRRLSTDLKTARDVQSRFLPTCLPRVPGLDYYGDCRPAGEVGGDFFDFVSVETKDLVLSVGDVSGHGVSAAILMSGLQTSLRSLTAHRHQEISAVVEELNRTVWQVSPENFYATLFYAALDPLRRQLHYVSAGHEPALLIRKRGLRAHRLESTGTVLGLTARATYPRRSIPLEPGDLLVAFTDGISEAADPRGRELRDTGVLDVVRKHPEARSAELVGYIMDAVSQFTDQSAQADDRTVVVVRYTGTEEKHVFEHRTAELAFAAA